MVKLGKDNETLGLGQVVKKNKSEGRGKKQVRAGTQGKEAGLETGFRSTGGRTAGVTTEKLQTCKKKVC